jgi:hypothetical protein
MAHAYLYSGEIEQGIEAALEHAKQELGLDPQSPDLVVLRFGLFSVDDARKLADIAYAAPVAGDRKAIVVSLTRFFHEAQNALLKLFEEPPQGVTLYLVVPTEGLLLATLRSRLTTLVPTSDGSVSSLTSDFLAANDAGRRKLIDSLLDRTKSDKDEEKQRARNEAVLLLEGLTRAGEAHYRQAKGEVERQEMRALLDDLSHFLPLLHTRSAPLKLVFEHLLLVIPKGLA